ncbi:MAG: HAD-IC family P-type ATPase [Geobacteraceae bacterium]
MRLGIAILAVIFINAIFTFIQEYRTEKAIEELRKMLPFRVAVIRNGAELECDAAEIVPGDLVMLREGDKVPADARVVEASRLTVNNSLLTGESDSRLLTDAPCEGEPLDSGNLVFAGTLVVSGSGQAVVYATGMATEFGKIAQITAGAHDNALPAGDHGLSRRHHSGADRQRPGLPFTQRFHPYPGDFFKSAGVGGDRHRRAAGGFHHIHASRQFPVRLCPHRRGCMAAADPVCHAAPCHRRNAEIFYKTQDSSGPGIGLTALAMIEGDLCRH